MTTRPCHGTGRTLPDTASEDTNELACSSVWFTQRPLQGHRSARPPESWTPPPTPDKIRCVAAPLPGLSWWMTPGPGASTGGRSASKSSTSAIAAAAAQQHPPPLSQSENMSVTPDASHAAADESRHREPGFSVDVDAHGGEASPSAQPLRAHQLARLDQSDALSQNVVGHTGNVRPRAYRLRCVTGT